MSDANRKINNIQPRNLSQEMQESYLDYAMSVIVSRALPDVRDGLKPVHRRILYTMHEMGLHSSSRFRKSAAITGEVLAKYHPHGDAAVYDAMVRLAQEFNMRYPLIWPQGNFGSVDGDNAAHQRYTEAKMTPIARVMLEDIQKETVDWMDNYEGTRKEPKVLPSAMPQLLLNGTLGIAVGMATNIPPHNLKEIVDATVHLIDNPKATTEDLMRYVQGPDFPTGGAIYNRKAILEAYGQGRGPIVIRGKAEIKELFAKSENRSGQKNTYIEITEIPYQVNKSALIEKMAQLVQAGKLDSIKDIRDESDRVGMSIVIELKKDSQPKKILNKLYKFTELQKTFHLNMIALSGGIQPQLLNLKEALEQYIAHKREVVRRRTQYDLKIAKERTHILEGLKKALDNIDKVIQTIKASKDRVDAHKNLRARFKFTQKQADAILDMRLQNLANLERKKVDDELREKRELIKGYELLLKSAVRMKTKIKKELQDIQKQFGDERRTKVYASAVGEFSEEDLIPKEDTVISMTKDGYIKRVPPSAYRAQHRGGKGIIGMETRGEDVVEHFLSASAHDRLLFFTNQGRVFQTLAYELPASTRIARGKALANFLELQKDEYVTAIVSLAREEKSESKEDNFLVMATQNGIIKKTPVSDFENVRRSGLIALRLKRGDILQWVGISGGGDEIIMTTKNGQSIRFSEKDVRPMGRVAAGVKGITLKGDDKLAATDIITKDDVKRELLIVTESGYGKKTAVSLFKQQKRGGAGVKSANITEKTGKITSARVVREADELIAISGKGHVIRTALKSIPKLGRATQGVRIMKLAEGDKVASVALV
jgi:DNA gyrase subunit A